MKSRPWAVSRAELSAPVFKRRGVGGERRSHSCSRAAAMRGKNANCSFAMALRWNSLEFEAQLYCSLDHAAALQLPSGSEEDSSLPFGAEMIASVSERALLHGQTPTADAVVKTVAQLCQRFDAIVQAVAP